jgi:hypothetical protein
MVTVTPGVVVLPAELVAVAVNVVVPLTANGPTLCVVWPAAPVPVHDQLVACPPLAQLTVSVTCTPAVCEPVGAPEMLQLPGFRTVFDQATGYAADSGP